MVSATGLGSGIDIEGLVTGLVNAERVPAEQRLLQREAKVTTLVSAFGTAKGSLSDLQTSIADLKTSRPTARFPQLRARPARWLLVPRRLLKRRVIRWV